MKQSRIIALSLALAVTALAAPASRAQGVGSKVPVVELEGYAQTPAKSFDEFLGRAVLFEFFAYW